MLLLCPEKGPARSHSCNSKKYIPARSAAKYKWGTFPVPACSYRMKSFCLPIVPGLQPKRIGCYGNTWRIKGTDKSDYFLRQTIFWKIVIHKLKCMLQLFFQPICFFKFQLDGIFHRVIGCQKLALLQSSLLVSLNTPTPKIFAVKSVKKRNTEAAGLQFIKLQQILLSTAKNASSKRSIFTVTGMPETSGIFFRSLQPITTKTRRSMGNIFFISEHELHEFIANLGKYGNTKINREIGTNYAYPSVHGQKIVPNLCDYCSKFAV